VRVPGVATLATGLLGFMTCPACGGDIKFSTTATVNGWQSRFVAQCHGSTETLVLNEEIALSGDPYAWERAVRVWRAGLFMADCQPDVMELLRANRNPWVSS